MWWPLCLLLLLQYNSTGVRDSFEEPEYAMVDTLFSLAEAYLFCQLVELVVRGAGGGRGGLRGGWVVGGVEGWGRKRRRRRGEA